MPTKILKKPQVPSADAVAPAINQPQMTKPESQQPRNPVAPERASNAESKADSAAPHSGNEANIHTSKVVSKSQPEAAKDEGAEKSFKNKQTTDNFSKQFKTLQNKLIDLVNSLRKTYNSKWNWNEDFAIDSFRAVLTHDWSYALQTSGNENLDLMRVTLATEIKKTLTQLIELCKDQQKKNGGSALEVENDRNLVKVRRDRGDEVGET